MPSAKAAQPAVSNKTASKKGSAPAKAPRRPAEGTRPAARTATVHAKAPANGRRIQVRRSGVHGKGVFALAPIAKGEFIIEYKGEIINWDEALRRHPHDPSQPNHTFYFHLEGGDVIDGAVDGNAARWINHACEPNCEAEEDEDNRRIRIHALRNIKPGEELFFDYRLVIDARLTPKLKAEYACLCGSKKCRGTMLGKK